MNLHLHYLVRLHTFNQDFYLLWKDGASEPDRYITLPRCSKFLLAKTELEIITCARELGIVVSNQQPHVVDMVGMQRILKLLRPSRKLPKGAAQILLESWNALEDMGNSIGSFPMPADPTMRLDAQRVYDKLFYGNNLPPVTPEGFSYQVTLTHWELDVLRKVMRSAWRKICESSAQFNFGK